MKIWIVVGLLLSALGACAPYPYYDSYYPGGYYHGRYYDRPYHDYGYWHDGPYWGDR
jgi:hypothetical protein